MISAVEHEYFLKPEGTVIAIPTSIAEDSWTIASQLKKRSLGIEIGEMKKQDFIPSHALALSTAAGKSLPKLELEEESALRFLKKENIWQAEFPKGWALACHNGLPLGWLKVMENRSNNYLPTHWRIRMDLK